ncbi:MAG: hypothetical protein ACI837_003110 [Crocinitomicaceae bacterium]|jgi:hypothetical protein
MFSALNSRTTNKAQNNSSGLNIFTLLAIFLLLSNLGFSQCVDTSNIYSFDYNGHSYDVVKENKEWTEASSCAVILGGYLAEINDSLEQDEIFSQLTTNAGINISNTQNQFGTASVWIGGSDAVTEGEWLWDGDNDGVGPQFWSGGPTGMPIGGLYSNWGVSPAEPDNSGGQDRLTIIIKPTATNFGLWNDLISTNSIYYLIEYNSTSGIIENDLQSKLRIYPNPSSVQLTVEFPSEFIGLKSIEVFSIDGKSMMTTSTHNQKQILSIENLSLGFYLIVATNNGMRVSKKILIE